MIQILPDVWETEVESPFPGLTTHAYLVIRRSGNVLFYNTGHTRELDRMEALGGVTYQFLSHRDELGESLKAICQRFGTKLGGHVREQGEFARICAPDILFDQREVLLGNIEVIPTPGHTPGSTCFLVHSAHGQRYLFTGDTLYLGDDGTWKPGLLAGSDKDALSESLRLLRELKPDVAFSSAFGGEYGYQDVSADWLERVQQALDQLRG
ncbi:MBL fold metallo-hydrolase [Sedimenticola hydrogenitrophicus]|uniref:MBL fold metallo-hydrolase n=1 Tax=Sedimenticola hydrogenitrophicus TaxID=2967975 RepID=UPI0021A5AFD6|nr:MBL fold metallo-hydrolase [Sedimenticola hydrogenitrophicus]